MNPTILALISHRPRPSPAQVRRALSRRAQYLAEQIRHRGACGAPTELFAEELAALAYVWGVAWPATP